MPKVPVYDNFQVAPTVEREMISPGQTQPLSAEIMSLPSRQAMAMGGGMMKMGEAMSNIAVDMQKDVNEARVKERDVQLAKQHEEILVRYGSMQGKNAVDGYAGVKKELTDLQTKLSEGLENDMQRRMYADVSNKRTLGALSNVDSHWMAQTRQYQDDQSVSRIDRSVADMGVNWALWQQENGLYQRAKATALQEIEQRGARRGWDNDTIESEKHKAMNTAHSDVVGKMLSSRLIKEAKEYLTAHTGEIDGKTFNTLNDKVKVFDISQAGMDMSKDIWGKLGPQKLNDPVKIADMEKEADKIYANDPDKAKATKDELRAKLQAHNAQQTEQNAANINIVMDKLISGVPLSRVKTEQAWIDLPGAEHAKIEEHQNNRAAALESRAAARESRAFTAMQREDYKNDRKMAGAYYAYNDPDVLASIKSRSQVQAMLPVLGERYTGLLLQRWDAIQTTEGKLTASMDTTQFNALADKFQLKPYKDNKTEDEKQQLGYVHSKVNEAIQARQAQSRLPLQPEEKEAIMREVMAITVKKGMPWYKFGGTQNVPAVMVSPDDDVIVPDADRTEISKRLKKFNAEQPENPLYEPTERNIRYWYVQGKITGKKGGK